MKLITLLACATCLIPGFAQEIKRNIPYAENGHERRVLDVYSPPNASNLPVVFLLHGGGWQAGGKSEVKLNDDLGLPDDPATRALDEFVASLLMK